MLTVEENELLTRIGPGTPCGELHRRYWRPFATVAELSETNPTRFVRLLGEDLVLFRDKSGRVGLIADHCPHRGASLLYGRVEERGIACAYHGWLYDVNGNCLETPAEPADSLLHLTVKHRAYPVCERYGLYWAYLGPPSAPVLPRYDLLELGLGPLTAGGEMRVDCNWLQVVENNVDQSHTVILHQGTRLRGQAGSNTSRGLIDEIGSLEYTEAPFGIKRHRVDKTGYDDTDLWLFPGGLRIYNHVAWRVPIDDTHTLTIGVSMDLSGVEPAPKGSSWPLQYRQRAQPGKTPPDAVHPVATYRMDKLQFQDWMAVETQGPIWHRETERLATADKGVALLRQILFREIQKVHQGLDPIAVIRDPENDLIDTYVDGYLALLEKFPIERERARAAL